MYNTAAAMHSANTDGYHSPVCHVLCRYLSIHMQTRHTFSHVRYCLLLQFEWFEAARRAGLTPAVGLCQGLLQYDAGDIVLDWLPPAAELPVLPGGCTGLLGLELLQQQPLQMHEQATHHQNSHWHTHSTSIIASATEMCCVHSVVVDLGHALKGLGGGVHTALTLSI